MITDNEQFRHNKERAWGDRKACQACPYKRLESLRCLFGNWLKRFKRCEHQYNYYRTAQTDYTKEDEFGDKLVYYTATVQLYECSYCGRRMALGKQKELHEITRERVKLWLKRQLVALD